MNSRIDLVVARYGEDIRWLRKVPAGLRVMVYDKGAPSRGGIPLPNLGREAHAYLHHIATRYNDLADITVFVQGHPFDHEPKLHRVLRALAEEPEPLARFWWLGFLCDTDDARGRRLFVPWSKNPAREELALDDFHSELFDAPGPSLYRFFGGGQFWVKRCAVHSRDSSFYARALALSQSFPNAAHCFERCWDRVFGEDGTGVRVAPHQTTAYFKRVRRLEGGKEPLVPQNGTG